MGIDTSFSDTNVQNFQLLKHSYMSKAKVKSHPCVGEKYNICIAQIDPSEK